MISLAGSTVHSAGLRRHKLAEYEVVRGTTLVRRGFAHMQKHGVIMDMTTVEQAQTAEEAGAVAVMMLDKIPYDVWKDGL